MERSLDKQTLAKYINQYEGHSRYIRLITLADKNEWARKEAIVMCYELAIKEKKLQ
jgi:hypothetical protein